MYEILYYERAREQLKKLSPSIQERILSSLERIRVRPFHFVKRKQGTKYFILRVGKYRLILDIRKKELIVLVVELGLRGKIYKH